jgi:hypothetical protein
MSTATALRAGMDITNSTDLDVKYKVAGGGGSP